MIDLVELHDFCLVWQMGYDTENTLKEWFDEMGISYESFKYVVEMQGWWVGSMQKIEQWS